MNSLRNLIKATADSPHRCHRNAGNDCFGELDMAPRIVPSAQLHRFFSNFHFAVFSLGSHLSYSVQTFPLGPPNTISCCPRSPLRMFLIVGKGSREHALFSPSWGRIRIGLGPGPLPDQETESLQLVMGLSCVGRFFSFAHPLVLLKCVHQVAPGHLSTVSIPCGEGMGPFVHEGCLQAGRDLLTLED